MRRWVSAAQTGHAQLQSLYKNAVSCAVLAPGAFACCCCTVREQSCPTAATEG
jgi:hypothetical protein